jgi:RNA polymerase sigma-70 factor (ECF subfamily)
MSETPPALAEIVARHRPELTGYLARLLGNRADAEDACQETLLRAHRAFARLAPASNSRAWLYRIATNCALTALRRRKRTAARGADVDVDLLPAPSARPEQRAELRALARAIERLPPRQRVALVLRQFQGLAYAEIAASVGGSEAGARANVYQAIRTLRRALGEGRHQP